jgi:hypothetical protein
MIDSENKQVEHNRTKGVGKTKAFGEIPVNLDGKKIMKDDRGRVVDAITCE